MPCSCSSKAILVTGYSETLCFARVSLHSCTRAQISIETGQLQQFIWGALALGCIIQGLGEKGGPLHLPSCHSGCWHSMFFYLRTKELSDGCHNLMQGVGKHTKAV